MRNKIFISHATPDDNEFTKWLALKLIGLGYEVWCDVLELSKGVDFWKTIEKEIRDNAIKFLVVLSEISNQREGVLNEVTTAIKTKKSLKDDTFIVPLTIDENLAFDNINIELIRLNAIDFKKSWAIGLQDLISFLEKQNIPKSSPNPERSNQLYQQIFLQSHSIVEREERYISNWFPITEFPKELRFHLFDRCIPDNFDTRKLTFPAIPYKKYLCTFAYEYDFMHQLPKTETYNSSKTIRISTNEILNGEYDSEFISNAEAKRLIIQIANKAFDKQFISIGLNQYEMSNKVGYWFKKDQLEKNKFNKILLVGKQKDKNWHFGISANVKLFPEQVLSVSSHIYFTEDGDKIIASKSMQHSARRKQGKGWFNIDWKEKLLAFVQYLGSNENTLYLEVGSEEKIFISTKPIEFLSSVSYNLPDKNTLEEEAEMADINELDDMNLEEEVTVNVEA